VFGGHGIITDEQVRHARGSAPVSGLHNERPQLQVFGVTQRSQLPKAHDRASIWLCSDDEPLKAQL
jgi:hypothetical protein